MGAKNFNFEPAQLASQMEKNVKKKLSDNVVFHKQSWQMMETGVFMFQIGNCQLASTM